jgi:hypothetical protein
MFKKIIVFASLSLILFACTTEKRPSESADTNVYRALGERYIQALSRGNMDEIRKMTLRPLWVNSTLLSDQDLVMLFQEEGFVSSRGMQLLSADYSYELLQSKASNVWQDLQQAGFKPETHKLMLIAKANSNQTVHFFITEQSADGLKVKGIETCLCEAIYKDFLPVVEISIP